jgi:hypothetical protein
MFDKIKSIVADPFVRQTAKEVVGAVVVTSTVLITTVFVKAVMGTVVDAINGEKKPVEQN